MNQQKEHEKITVYSPESGIRHPLFVIIGTMLWQVFIESVNAPSKGIASGRSMLAKINFPRESLILTGKYEVIFNLLIKLVIILIIFIYYGLTPSFSALASLVGFFIMLVLGSSFGLILVPIGMLYSDVQRAIGLVLRFAMYLMPVIYPAPKSGLAAKLMSLNPVAPVLTYTATCW